MSATQIPIPGVHSSTLKEVVAYMNRHKGTEPPIVEKPLRSKVCLAHVFVLQVFLTVSTCCWPGLGLQEMKDVCKNTADAEWIDALGDNRQALYDLILAANYMDIKALLHLGCAKVASLIKGQPLEKIKGILSTGVDKDKPPPVGPAAPVAT